MSLDRPLRRARAASLADSAAGTQDEGGGVYEEEGERQAAL